MTRAGPLSWRSDAGWLVLGGGGRWELGETGPVDGAALGWADTDRPMAVLLTAGGATAEGEDLLEYYADMGGATGYIMPIFTAADAQQAENCRLLVQAGLVYIADGPEPLRLVRALRDSPALEALATAFEDGAAIVTQGMATTALGAWLAASQGPEPWERGLEWVPDVVIEPDFSTASSATRLRNLLAAHPECLGLGIPKSSALALGPDGRVETVGEGRVTVVVGQLAVQAQADTDSDTE